MPSSSVDEHVTKSSVLAPNAKVQQLKGLKPVSATAKLFDPLKQNEKRPVKDRLKALGLERVQLEGKGNRFVECIANDEPNWSLIKNQPQGNLIRDQMIRILSYKWLTIPVGLTKSLRTGWPVEELKQAIVMVEEGTWSLSYAKNLLLLLGSQLRVRIRIIQNEGTIILSYGDQLESAPLVTLAYDSETNKFYRVRPLQVSSDEEEDMEKIRKEKNRKRFSDREEQKNEKEVIEIESDSSQSSEESEIEERSPKKVKRSLNETTVTVEEKEHEKDSIEPTKSEVPAKAEIKTGPRERTEIIEISDEEEKDVEEEKEKEEKSPVITKSQRKRDRKRRKELEATDYSETIHFIGKKELRSETRRLAEMYEVTSVREIDEYESDEDYMDKEEEDLDSANRYLKFRETMGKKPVDQKEKRGLVQYNSQFKAKLVDKYISIGNEGGHFITRKGDPESMPTYELLSEIRRYRIQQAAQQGVDKIKSYINSTLEKITTEFNEEYYRRLSNDLFNHEVNQILIKKGPAEQTALQIELIRSLDKDLLPNLTIDMTRNERIKRLNNLNNRKENRNQYSAMTREEIDRYIKSEWNIIALNGEYIEPTEKEDALKYNLKVLINYLLYTLTQSNNRLVQEWAMLMLPQLTDEMMETILNYINYQVQQEATRDLGLELHVQGGELKSNSGGNEKPVLHFTTDTIQLPNGTATTRKTRVTKCSFDGHELERSICCSDCTYHAGNLYYCGEQHKNAHHEQLGKSDKKISVEAFRLLGRAKVEPTNNGNIYITIPKPEKLEPPIQFRIIDKTITIPAYNHAYVKCQVKSLNGTPISQLVGAIITTGTDHLIPKYELKVMNSVGIIDKYGEIGIAVTNPTPNSKRLAFGTLVCDGYFIKIGDVSKPVSTGFDTSINKKAKKSAKIHRNNSLSKTSNLINVDKYKQRLEALKKEFSDVLAKDSDPPGRTNAAVMTIDTGDAAPISQKSYRYPPEKREFIEKEVALLLEQKIISESKSPWASPIVVAPKPGGGWRMCVDFRAVNDVTVKDTYPLPQIKDILENMIGARIFSKLDLHKAFHQIYIDPKDREKTAFITNKGLYEYNLMPFGLANAPSVFQRCMDKVLRTLNWYCCLVYIDDIVIYSKNMDDHLDHLRLVFTALRTAKLKARESKCLFFQTEMKFLGHIINEDGHAPDPDKIAAVVEFERPTDYLTLKRFLGMARYYSEFVNNFSAIAQPLDELTKKGTNVVEKWDAKAEQSFINIKKALTESPVLIAPDFTKPFILYTDASNEGIGAVLCQVKDGKEHPIRFASKSLNKAEKAYATIEQEALAVHWAVTKFAEYFDGNRKFTIITDHNPLVWLMKARNWNKKLERWSLSLSSYWFDIVYRKGKDNVVADALSRKPLYPKKAHLGEPTEEELDGLAILGQGNTFHQPIKYYKANKPDENVSIIHQNKKMYIQPPKLNQPLIHALKAAEQVEDITETEIEDRSKKFTTMLNESIQSRQEQDPALINIINRIQGIEIKLNKAQEKQLLQDINSYELFEGILMHIEKVDNNQIIRQMVIPKSLQPEILMYYHDSPYGGGHGGVQRTYTKIQQRYYWKGMHKDIQHHVTRCIKCLERKNRPYVFAVPGMARNEANRPMHTIAIDYVGPLPSSGPSKFKYIMVIVDQFSRYTICTPVKNKSAESAARVLIEQVYTKFGFPDHVLSDNDPAFVSQLMRCIFNWCDIQHITTSIYHPQANGFVERFNAELKNIISMYCNERTNNWHLFVHFVPLCYNSMIHSITGYTPSKVFLGWEIKLPSDLFYGELRAYKEDLPGTDFVSEMEIQIKSIREIIKQRWKAVGKEYEDLTSAKVNILTFEPNDLVFYQNPGGYSIPKSMYKRRINFSQMGREDNEVGERNTIATKLKRRWTGPFKIIKRINPTTYVIRHVLNGANSRNDNTVHVMRLKKCPIDITREVMINDYSNENRKKLDQLAQALDELNAQRGNLHTRVYLGNGLFKLIEGKQAHQVYNDTINEPEEMKENENENDNDTDMIEDHDIEMIEEEPALDHLLHPHYMIPTDKDELELIGEEDQELEENLKRQYEQERQEEEKEEKEEEEPQTSQQSQSSTITVNDLSNTRLNPHELRQRKTVDRGPFLY